MTNRATKLTYQLDSYRWEAEATVLGVESSSLSNEGKIILDETIMHPQGGGQPSDHGVIMADDMTVTFTVKSVTIDMDLGQVTHSGEYADQEHRFLIGQRVILKVDPIRRMLMARWHSAGHLINIAMEELGIVCKPYGTSHFPGQAFVAYRLILQESAAHLEQLRISIEEATNVLIKENLPCHIHFYQPSSLLPEDYAELPEKARRSESVRMIEFGDRKPVRPCGGTHVAWSGEVGRVVIRKISLKKNRDNGKKSDDEGIILSVSYEVIE